MSRPLVVGNGRLLVTLDRDLSIRDLHWPYIGLYNHLSGNRGRIGIWVDGAFSWLGNGDWDRKLVYEPNTLVTDATAKNDSMGIGMRLKDCVLHSDDILIRRFTFDNLWTRERELRLFLAHDFHISETDIADTAFYNPYLEAVIHYKRDVYMLLSARRGEEGIYQYATGIKGFGGAQGTWVDAEDGELSMSPISQGSVDSVFSVRVPLAACGSEEVTSWICLGRNLDDVANLNWKVGNRAENLAKSTASYWTGWSDTLPAGVTELPEPIPDIFRRSLLTIRTNVDERGAIIAANDSDIMETARAHYSYMWPRDGALIAAALDRCGYHELTRRFIMFCCNALPKDRAALMHKYSSDGSWGSTWHPWIVDGEPEIPFQEDSTALVLWALKRHYEREHDYEFIGSMYRQLVAPCADFIVSYRDPATGLPLPSYDLWEERRGVHAYTCGTVYGALEASAAISDLFQDGRAEQYRAAAAEVRRGIEEHLWDDQAGRFARRLIPKEGGYERDLIVDSSLYALFAFGALPADDPRIEVTMRKVISRLWVQTDVGGIARYEDDHYFRRSEDVERIPGNPWFICTLWAAQWYIAHARTRGDLTTAMELLQWVARRALPSGIMPEQLHPETGEHLSVAPLTWSHGEFVSTTLDYVERFTALPEE